MTEKIESLRKQLTKFERRLQTGAVEVRAEGEAEGNRLALRIPYNKRSETIFGFTEIITPTAFTKSLQQRGSDVLALWNHNTDYPLGRMSGSTLEIKNTDVALEAVVTLDRRIQWHDNAYRSVERGDVQGTSFGFETVRDNWLTEEDGAITRELVEVKLFELSPTPFPAYPDSEAESRSARAVFDVASVRAGCDLSALAAALIRAEEGRIVEADAPEVRSLLERLNGMLPALPVVPSVVPREVREREIALRLRKIGIAA